mmetsp:Transcript_11434/g.19317  ORF Transcript_11434/g.19317 Transcript_11434/m.19317 type:complete len:91 (-) Transcript_11434:253-525(-)
MLLDKMKNKFLHIKEQNQERMDRSISEIKEEEKIQESRLSSRSKDSKLNRTNASQKSKRTSKGKVTINDSIMESRHEDDNDSNQTPPSND